MRMSAVCLITLSVYQHRAAEYRYRCVNIIVDFIQYFIFNESLDELYNILTVIIILCNPLGKEGFKNQLHFNIFHTQEILIIRR